MKPGIVSPVSLSPRSWKPSPGTMRRTASGGLEMRSIRAISESATPTRMPSTTPTASTPSVVDAASMALRAEVERQPPEVARVLEDKVLPAQIQDHRRVLGQSRLCRQQIHPPRHAEMPHECAGL